MSEIKGKVKIALENMYMFGGMPRPDPNYDTYISKLQVMIMKSIKDSTFTKEQMEKAFRDGMKHEARGDENYFDINNY